MNLKKLFSFLVLLSGILIFSGCVNPYSQFYYNTTGGIQASEIPDVILPTGKPILVQGTNIDNDVKHMLGNGYLLLGYSSFNAGETSQNLAIEHAKKVFADTVIVYGQYTNTVSGSMPMTVPNTQTTYHSGSIYGSGGGFANYSGTSTSYGNRTTYVPYNINRYDYYASFWIKAKPPSLGVHINELTDEIRKEIESNKGVCIFVVIKDSPAFNADLLSGDIIRKINDAEVADGASFMKLIAENKGQLIKLEIFRNGETIIKEIQLD